MARQRIVVVTGASAGIGRAVARRFGRDHWRVALIARGVDGLEAARQEIEELGGEAMVIPCDVADEAAVDAAAERVEREWGPIEVWINDAMVTSYCEFLDIPPADFRRMTEVTYLGSVWGIRAAMKRMVPRNRGTIVQVGSALIVLFALVALFALAILFGLSGADYATRTIHPAPWVAPNGY